MTSTIYKKFVVVVRKLENIDWKRYYGILTSYTIMKATIITLAEHDLFPLLCAMPNVGTVVHIDTEENIRSALSMYSDFNSIRYIGYVNVTEGILTNIQCIAYVGIPISMNYVEDITTPSMMRNIVYPNITLEPLQGGDQLACYYKLVGKPVDFKLCDTIIETSNSLSYSVLINDKEYSVTRCIAFGKSPVVVKKEMVGKRGETYLNLVGYPIIM